VRRALAVLLLVLAAGDHPARAQGADCIGLEDFSSSPLGAFPTGWAVRAEEGRPVYSVREENGRRFLRAVSRGVGVQAGLRREWDLARYPVLVWWWRPVEFPLGADERSLRASDSALAVYLLVASSSLVGPKAVKYIWSEKVPAGTRLSSNFGQTQVRVLESGTVRRGEWVEERVDALRDFRAYFAESGTPTPAGIAVLTDADDTRSSAQGDYADFRACAR
jgi:Protein of unknown function (DUF3047)